MYKVLEIIMHCLISVIMLKYALAENAMAVNPHSCAAIVTFKGFKMNRMETAHQVAMILKLFQQADRNKSMMRNKEEIRLRQSVKDRYRWRYFAPVIIEALAGCYFLFRKP